MLGWPLGLLRVTWRYLWRTTPVHRSGEPGGPEDVPAPLPDDLVDERTQTASDGVGPLLHRRYSVFAEKPQMTPEEVMRHFREEPNWSTPGDVAVFVKTRGEPGDMRLGEEYVVRMPGPYNGPVRVVGRDATRIRLATLAGHLEAGQIEFRTRGEADGLRFEIESWARSGDRLSHLLYNHLRLAKEIQLTLWVETCLTVAARSGGRLRGGATVHTRTLDPDAFVRYGDEGATGRGGTPATAGTGTPRPTP